MNTLYICEKPSQARDIAKVLGVGDYQDGYIQGGDTQVTWCLGHLLSLAPPNDYCEDLQPWRMSVLPIVPKTWRMLPNPKTKKQLRVIKTLLKTTDKVIVATDADREGDVIGREVLEFCNYTGEIERLWLSALDDSSIKKALADIRPGSSTYPLYQAGLGRQRADWMIGMNMTMATSALFGQRGQGVLSVGRVQTPALNLVVQRDDEIENFKTKDYFELKVQFKSDAGEFWTWWEPSDELTDLDGRCLKKEIIEHVIKTIEGKTGHVTKFEEKKRKTSAPVCFSLSSLQKLCNSKFGFGAKETLKIAQSLYEEFKATSYPRTDTGYLPLDQLAESQTVVKAIFESNPSLADLEKFCDLSFKSPVWNDKKVTAHHGIIPTSNSQVNVKGMNTEQRKVYDLICRYYLAQFMGDYTYMQRSVVVECEQEVFASKCNTPQAPGWKQAINPALEDKEENDEAEQFSIPKLSVGDPAQSIDTQTLSKKTKPPARFTEGTLIAAMKNVAKFVDNPELKKTLKETSGIGTEATRADIIEKLLARDYINRNKKQLISTRKGRSLIKILPVNMTNPGTTALWEQTLDDIATGDEQLHDFLLDQEDILDFMLEDLEELHRSKPNRVDNSPVYPCPKCQSPLARRKGKHGFFWSCTEYPDCNGMMVDSVGKPIVKAQPETSDIDCPACSQGKLVRRKGKKSYWWGCNHYPTCKQTFFDLKGKPNFAQVKPKRNSDATNK